MLCWLLPQGIVSKEQPRWGGLRTRGSLCWSSGFVGTPWPVTAGYGSISSGRWSSRLVLLTGVVPLPLGPPGLDPRDKDELKLVVGHVPHVHVEQALQLRGDLLVGDGEALLLH